jgi:hypothetical protein
MAVAPRDHPLSEEEVKILMGKEAYDTRGRRGADISGDIPGIISDRLFKKAKKEEGIGSGQTGWNTKAREAALGAFRTIYAYAIGLLALSGFLPSYAKWNIDGSMFWAQCSGTGQKFCFTKPGKDAPRQSHNRIGASERLAIGLKWMFGGNGDGRRTDTVIMVKVKGMQVDTFFVQEVQGLDGGGGFSEKGRLVFVSENVRLSGWWNYYFENIIVENINAANVLYDYNGVRYINIFKYKHFMQRNV